MKVKIVHMESAEQLQRFGNKFFTKEQIEELRSL